MQDQAGKYAAAKQRGRDDFKAGVPSDQCPFGYDEQVCRMEWGDGWMEEKINKTSRDRLAIEQGKEKL